MGSIQGPLGNMRFQVPKPHLCLQVKVRRVHSVNTEKDLQCQCSCSISGTQAVDQQGQSSENEIELP